MSDSGVDCVETKGDAKIQQVSLGRFRNKKVKKTSVGLESLVAIRDMKLLATRIYCDVS